MRTTLPLTARRSQRAVAVALAAVLTAVALAGCSGARGAASPDEGTREAAKGMQRPPARAGFDYQIGGGYPSPSGVRVVSRDRGDSAQPGKYNICYVNAFQAQPDALDWWQRHHPRLLLRGEDGEPVLDREWDEALFDLTTAERREALARLVGRWIDGCADKDFQAVELDNLDSYERSGGRLGHADNAAFAALLTRRAHRAGLAAGQKNAAELLPRRARMGFDFAVTEECGQYDECEQYAAAYDDRVLDVEYGAKGLAAACRQWGDQISVVRRDLDVLPEGREGHVSERC
ncbi:hypothetical protein DTL70_18740 [Streptomyces diacarni]|uniref:Glycoside-hydrolase family GH114 TIM-barrel domain-containing protein n=1 Tax=Streptomyces diacarni TaxID=2800381 RepID=A0A367EUR3_9ACTN|nr:endo alpha-1,4 polygalactosaminidase [Streptomyces diacarni]RCG21459.1 hypothetical protein DTL70_18740 [Streptomyces diacarni]